MTAAKASLILIIVILIFSPLLPTELEDTLILCSGLSNFVAILDITRSAELFERGDVNRGVRLWLTVELVCLTWIIGADFGHLVKNTGARIGIAIVVFIIAVIYTAYIGWDDNRARHFLLLGFLIAIAIGVNTIGVAILKDQMLRLINYIQIDVVRSFIQTNIDFMAKRSHAWVHLLFIPLLYAWVDYRIRDRVPTAKKSLVLDVEILLVGVACAFAGLRAHTPQFEAGAAAAVLLLGNFVYVSYIHAATSPEIPLPQPQIQNAAAAAGTN